MESATTANATSMKSAARVATAVIPMTIAATVGPARTTVPSAAPVSRATPISASSPAQATAPVPVVPGTGADEYSIREPVRPVVAIRGAGIRVIIVVPVRTDRRPSHVAISRPESHANTHPYLRLRIGKRHHQNRQQREIL
jgi:hypothetical protein